MQGCSSIGSDAVGIRAVLGQEADHFAIATNRRPPQGAVASHVSYLEKVRVGRSELPYPVEPSGLGCLEDLLALNPGGEDCMGADGDKRGRQDERSGSREEEHDDLLSG